MASHGQFNTRSPTIKRILKEAAELSTVPSPDYHAGPLESNLFEWHFTLRGPPEPSPYAAGIYHGRIVLPPTYPLRPPSFRFLTPSGRFEVNREICLSISGFHEETWQPAWGVRTALVALRSFMDGEAKGQVGGVEASKETRAKMAADSGSWRCAGCGSKSNTEIMVAAEKEWKRAENERGGAAGEEVVVPEELRLGYREDITANPADDAGGDGSNNQAPPLATAAENDTTSVSSSTPPSIISRRLTSTEQSTSSALNTTSPMTSQLTQRHPPRPEVVSPSRSWLDMAILGIGTALAVMVIKKILHIF